MRSLRRESLPADAVERLSREIQVHRRRVRDSVADMLAADSPDAAAGARVYQVFASFQADFQRNPLDATP